MAFLFVLVPFNIPVLRSKGTVVNEGQHTVALYSLTVRIRQNHQIMEYTLPPYFDNPTGFPQNNREYQCSDYKIHNMASEEFLNKLRGREKTKIKALRRH